MADARNDVLRALRSALSDAGRPSPASAPLAAGPFGSDDWDTFADAVERTGAMLTVVDGWAEARKEVRAILQDESVRSAGRWNHPDLAPLDLPSLFDELNITLAKTTAELAVAEIGITSAHAVLAESGSVIVAASPGTPRATSLLPATHLAILPPGRTLPTIANLAPLLRRDTPSALHAISGPSSTGDIEMIVVKGVHGPIRVRIIAVRSE